MTDQERTPELQAWIDEQLAKAPDPSVDPERCAKLARLLGLAKPAGQTSDV